MAYTTIDDPSAHFQVKTYTGTSGIHDVTLDGNSDMQPDFVWFKNRDVGYVHQLYDSSRGVTKALYANGTNAETTITNGLTQFQTDGFRVTSAAAVNENSMVCWNWKANAGSTSSNTDGTITSTVQANQDAGFSIITYTGTGGGETFGHGLGVAPDMWIVKRRSGTGSWAVGFNDANILGGTSKYLILQGTGATSTYNNFWGSSPASSTVMRIAGDSTIGGSGSTYVAYAFAEKQGYSKFGKYIGNGSTNNTFVYTGFRPACVIIKCLFAASNWRIFDHKRLGYNPSNEKLYPNLANAESTATEIDFLSNGFKIRSSDTDVGNNDAGGYIYMAWAENPFVSSEGIPTTAR